MRDCEAIHLVDFQKRGSSIEGNLGDNQSPYCTIYENIPAKIVEITGRQAEFEHMILPTASHIVELRYLPELSEGMLIRWGCRTLGIGHISCGDSREMNGRKIYMKMLCTEDKTKVKT